MSTVQTAFKITAAVSGTNNVRALNNEINKISTSSEKMNRVVASAAWQLRGALSGLAAGYGGLQILRRADEFNMLRGRINLSTESVREADQAWKGLAGTSLRTGAELGGLVDVFQRLSFVRKELGATVDEMLVFTDTVSKLGAMSGASPEAMRAGLTQLGQGLSNSILRAEEFNSIMENIPAVGKAIADELGVSTGQLRNLVVDGSVLSKDVFAGLLNASIRIREQFEQYPESISRASAQFSQAFGIVAQGINETTGGTQAWIKLINIGTNMVLALGKIFEEVVNIIELGLNKVVSGIMLTIQRAVNAITSGINSVISAMNYIPGVDIRQFSQPFDTASFERAALQDAAKNRAEIAQADRAWMEALKGNRGAALGQGASASIGRKDISQDYAALAAGLAGGESGKKGKADKSVAAAAREAVQEMKALEKAREKAFSDSAAGQVLEYSQSIASVSKSIGESLVGAFRSAEDALVEFTQTGKLNWRDFANSVIEDLIRIQIQQSITGPLSNMLGSFLGGPQASASLAAARGASNPALFGPGFATGGSFKVGGSGGTDSQMVAFRASPDERVTVTRGDQGGGGFGNVSVVVNVDGSSDVSADGARGKALGQMIASIAKSTIINEKRPGGLLAGA